MGDFTNVDPPVSESSLLTTTDTILAFVTR